MMKKTTETTGTPEMVFTMGLPGAGKSTALKSRGFDATHEVIDPDLFKKSHPDYNPKNPGALHEWSSEKAEKLFLSALSLGGRWVVDGTGTNAEKMIRKITMAKALGFKVTLLYVRVSLKTAILRNSLRERVVPEWIIREKALDIATSFELVSPHVDTVDLFENDTEVK